MLSPRVRRALDRTVLAARVHGVNAGERVTREVGSSVEYLDFRPYQPGDELRAVDWRAYARSRRLITRLYRAERAIDVHLLLDVSPSMGLAGKLAYARTLAQLIGYVGQRDAVARVHTTAGEATAPARGVAGMAQAMLLLERAQSTPEAGAPVAAVREFALTLPRLRGGALLVVISDMLDPEPWGLALSALRARGLDATFVQVLAEEELQPPLGQFELEDVESGARRAVGADEARAYRAAMDAFLRRTRGALAQAGARHVLLTVPNPQATTPRAWPTRFASAAAADPALLALTALRRARILVPR